MLRACLDSLSRLTPPPGVDVVAIVVDNEPKPNNLEIVANARPGSPIDIHYVHHPDPGIPQARNACLKTSYVLLADWIAFIDDDEIAATDWISSLYASALKHKADVVTGPVKHCYPPDAAPWRRRSQYGDAGKYDGQELPTASTNNVLIRRRSIPKGHMFSRELRFVGGEDTLFFHQMHKAGAKIVWSVGGRVFEGVPWDRVTIAGHMRRSYRKGFCSVMTMRTRVAYGRAPRIAWLSVRRMLAGVAKVLASPAFILFGTNASMKTLLSGLRNLSEGAGVAVCLIGGSNSYYKKVSGG